MPPINWLRAVRVFHNASRRERPDHARHSNFAGLHIDPHFDKFRAKGIH
jgi:hypothetical protein